VPRLSLLRPPFGEAWEESLGADAPRSSPIDIEERVCRERTTVHLPDGLGVDELPDPVRLETAFGSYIWEVDRNAPPGELRVRREIVMRRMTLPPDQYPAVKSFWEKV